MKLNSRKLSLLDNNKLILKVFYEFNKLINNKFDCYYTGGLMLYISADCELRRYHSDIDLFINENQILKLKTLIENSNHFKIINNIDNKSINGHEYKIKYKDIPISIGLFLFKRKKMAVLSLKSIIMNIL